MPMYENDEEPKIKKDVNPITETKPCPICGESFEVPQTRPKQIYCSTNCSIIGRKENKNRKSEKRVIEFLEKFENIEIIDVFEGRLNSGTDNRMTVKGAREHENKKFIVLVVNE